MGEEREEGYYWVGDGNGKWVVAEWVDSSWHVTHAHHPDYYRNLNVVGPRITPPEGE
jgi:hypothetical protein